MRDSSSRRPRRPSRLLLLLAPALLHALVLLPAPPRRAPQIAHRATAPPRMVVNPSYLLAGGVCASLSHALATPIDVIKTRQQTMSSYRSLSFKHAFQRCYREEGAAALLLGLGPTLTGYFFEGALKFGAYEALKKPALVLLGAIVGAGPAASLGPLSAAIAGGAIASVVLAPAEATRIRQVSDPAYAGLGTLAATAKLYGAERAAGLFRGVPATLIKQLPYTAAKNVAFDALMDAGRFALPVGAPIVAGLLMPRWTVTFLAALAAACLATLASQPGDAILSEVSRTSRSGCRDRSVAGAYRQLGVAGLARGLRARFAHTGVIVTVQLILYDALKRRLGVP